MHFMSEIKERGFNLCADVTVFRVCGIHLPKIDSKSSNTYLGTTYHVIHFLTYNVIL